MAARWIARSTAVGLWVLSLTPPIAAEPIRVGFGSVTLPDADDISSPAAPLGFEVNFFGQTFSSIYVNSNGNLSFGTPLAAFSPVPLNQLGAMVVAPFFADVDNSISGQIAYGPGRVDGRTAFGATWQDVPYHSVSPTGANTFQALLVDRGDTGAGNFDLELNYGQVEWESGDLSGGVAGRGGQSARIGFSGGTAESTFELPGSGVPGELFEGGQSSLVTGLFASELPGRYRFQSRGGAFSLMAAEPLPMPDPEPTTPDDDGELETPQEPVTELPPPGEPAFPMPGENGEITPGVPVEAVPPPAPPGGPTSVPEPTTLLLAALGAGAVALRRGRELFRKV